MYQKVIASVVSFISVILQRMNLPVPAVEYIEHF